MASKLKDQFQMMYEAHKLLSTAVEALAKTSAVQDDPQIQQILDPANHRLWESRYWLGEAMNYMEEQIRREEDNRAKGN